ncbi:MAG: DHHA1 domain-containing protein [Promethearchaeota archaeon]|jgi:RecJ-like exonuclease
MNNENLKLGKLNADLKRIKYSFFNYVKNLKAPIQIYTHLDADGLSAGAILGKVLYRENIPFQITVLRQLERREIEKISEKVEEYNNYLIFSDFGSGQYQELQSELIHNRNYNNFLILDHHIPQNVSSKEDVNLLEEIHESTKEWHINPYFFEIDGSLEISGAGLSYYFAKCVNPENVDLSPLALIGAVGDIQNQGLNKSFLGLNKLVLEDAMNSGKIEVVNDLNFSTLKPLNEAIAYSKDVNLPGLSKDVNRTLIFLKTKGILMENSEGKVKTLNELDQDEKQKISSAIIEYASIKLDLEPSKIIKKLIVYRYLLKNELIGSEIHDIKEFSNLLNACGRTHNASLGIAIAMGDRKDIYQQSKHVLKSYRKSLAESLSWIEKNKKIQQRGSIQYFMGEEVIPESIIGTITSILIFGQSKGVDISKPIFGLAKRTDEDVYKVSGRAHEKIVSQGVNLSLVIKEASNLSNIDSLGGGHPPAAGTKIPIEKLDVFLENCNLIVRNQLQNK